MSKFSCSMPLPPSLLQPQPPVLWVPRLWHQLSAFGKRTEDRYSSLSVPQRLARGEAYRPVLLRRGDSKPGLLWSGLVQLGEHLRMLLMLMVLRARQPCLKPGIHSCNLYGAI